MVTPFNDDYSVDFDGLTRLTEYLVEGGVEFLVILGTTGESATLSATEKEQVIEHIMKVNAGRAKICIGCGGNNTSSVVLQIADWTAKYNPDAFLSVSPYYNKPSQEGIYRHFKTIAAATNVPIILYNVPGRTSSNLSPQTALRIAADCPNVLSIKEASGNLEQGMEIFRSKKDGFEVLSGDDILSLGMLATGYSGVISVIANAAPAMFSEMVRKGMAGDFDTARDLHYMLFRTMQLIFEEGNPAGIKAALKAKGICGDTVRLPLVSASSALSAKIAAEMAQLS